MGYQRERVVMAHLECAALAVRVLLVRVAGDDQQVVDLGQRRDILALSLRASTDA